MSEFTVLKKNPALAQKILDELRYGCNRELDEICPDCKQVKLRLSPEQDIWKYCPNCGVAYYYEDWPEAQQEKGY
jgi:uncharacterized Zn finger protein (UPF0148 family)